MVDFCRLIRLFVYFVLGLFLGGVAVARADYAPIIKYYIQPYQTYGAFEDPQEACSVHAEVVGWTQGGFDYVQGGIHYCGRTGAPGSASYNVLSNQCRTGDTLEGGVCKTPPPPCQAGVTVAGPSFFDYGTDAANTSALSGVFCYQVGASKCLAGFEGSTNAGSALVSGVRHYFAQGEFVTYAEACSTLSSAPAGSSVIPASTCPEGKVLVSGRCQLPAPPEGSEGVGSSSDPANTFPNDQTSGFNSKDPFKCSGDYRYNFYSFKCELVPCANLTTDESDPMVRDPNTGKCVFSSASSGAAQPDPESPGSASGRNASGVCGEFKCEGDAIDCAIARATQEMRCQQIRGEEEGSKYLDSIGQSEIDAEKAAQALNKDGIFDFDIFQKYKENEQAYLNFTAECIPSMSFEFKGNTYTFNTSPLCKIADLVRLLLRISAYMALLAIVNYSYSRK